MKKLFKTLIVLVACVMLFFPLKLDSEASVLTNVVVEQDGTEIRKLTYSTRDDVSKFVVILSFIYESFKFDFYERAQAFSRSEDKNVSYEYLWTMLWSKYMFQKGQSEQEKERAKFLAHLVLSNCVKDVFMKVYWPTLRNSIGGIIGSVKNSNKFMIEARKPKGEMWQDWKITVIRT